MKLSAKTRYAARLLFCMAKNGLGTPVSSSWLSTQTGISAQFIEQILRQLRSAGITNSIRGARGGHILIKDPSDITIANIIKIMEGGMNLSSCIGYPNACERCSNCTMHDVFEQLQDRLEKLFESVTLDDVVRNSQNKDGC